MFKVYQIDENHLQFSGWDKELSEDMVDEYQDSIDEGNSYGFLKSATTRNESTASHKVVDLEIDESGMISGEMELMDTPDGEMLKKMLKDDMSKYLNVEAVVECGDLTCFNIFIG